MLEAPVLSVRNFFKSYGTSLVLEGVDFDLYKGEVLGLVGENGAGKSTLLKILAGVISADQGNVTWEGEALHFRNTLEATKHGVGIVFQEQNLIPSIPVYENMFLGRQLRAVMCDKKNMIAKCRETFQELGIDVDPKTITGTLSLGVRQLLEIAKSLIQTEPKNGHRIILLDEPTEALSKTQIAHLFEIIRKNKTNASFIVVSHRLNESLELCNRIMVMKDGKVVTSMDVTPQTTEEQIHELMVGRQRDKEYYCENLQTESGENEVLVLNNVSRAGAFKNVSFSIREGEIVGLAGMLGSGRSELCQVIAGVKKFDHGTIHYFGEATSGLPLHKLIPKGVCYVPPERKEEGVILTQSVKWNLSMVKPPKSNNGITIDSAKEKRRAEEIVQRHGIKTKGINTTVEELSGGNQQKIVLGKWLIMRDKIRVLVVEEPTRGIDVSAKHEIYKLFRELTRQKITVLISTENLMELIGLCNRIIVMKDGCATATIEAPVQSKPHEVDIVKHMV